jgi:GntR family transcriptional regulator
MIQSLDRSNDEPLHKQLADVLRFAIQNGEFPPGEQIPSEMRLQSLFNVSRSVVRQALASLTSLGLIKRVKGSGATVVSRVTYHRLVQSQIGLAAQVSSLGAETATIVQSMERLGNPDGEFGKEDVQTWLPLPQFEGLTQTDLENSSLHKIMNVRYGISLAGGTRQVRAISSDNSLSKKLNIQKGSPLLLLTGENTDAQGLLVERFSTWHRSDLVSLDFTID